MSVETLKVVRIGNSRGVRLPARLLAQYRIRDTVEVECTAAGIVLPTRAVLAGPAPARMV